MMPARFDMKTAAQPEEGLFQAAARLAGAERAAFLDGACHANPDLRQRLEALLAANGAKDSFLEPEPSPLKTLKLDSPDIPDEAVGQTLGRYKLLEQARRRRLRRGVCRRADRAGPAARGAQGHQAGHGHQAGRRPVRGRAAGAGDDGSSEHRQGARCGHDRHGPALLRDGTGARHPDHRLLRPEPTSPPRNGSICSSRSARPSSTRTRRGSSTATSSPRTSSSRCTTACRCPR